MLDEFMIPKERIAVLIGPNGQTKKEIEQRTHCRMGIDSKSGDISIEGEDASHVLTAGNVVKAIGRGFSPPHAFRLFEEDHYFEIIYLPDLLGKDWKTLQSKKGRIIGKEGIIRKKIEQDTHTLISVYGKTISIIGKPDALARAVQAVTMLVKGAEHATVLNYLRQSLTAPEEFEFR
ncbi:MAG: KH domain-containing protein [Candidatus Diapherotrites archaeon]|nr:KH domain-containing protein [Candidatus Diapherotrites archaeon]MDZ4256757.1 KH domain-containing protein [archaeon]